MRRSRDRDMAMQELTYTRRDSRPTAVRTGHPRAVGAAPHDLSGAGLVSGLDGRPVAAFEAASPSVGSNLRRTVGGLLGCKAELQSPFDLCSSSTDRM
jgi:hypothetical protein